MMPEKRKRTTARASRTTPHALDPGSVRSDEVLRRVLGTLPAFVCRCRPDPDRTVEFMSLGCRTLTGFDPGDLVESRVVSYAEIIAPADRPRVLEVVRGAVRSGEPFTLTYRLRRVDGRELSVREHGCAVRGASGEVEAIEALVVAVKGLTERELERHAQDVAHDLNNVLATIKTTAELALLDARDAAVTADLAEIVSAAARGAELAGRLRRPSASSLPPPEAPGGVE